MFLIRSFLLSKSRRSRLRHPLVPILSENFAKIAIWDAHHPTHRNSQENRSESKQTPKWNLRESGDENLDVDRTGDSVPRLWHNGTFVENFILGLWRRCWQAGIFRAARFFFEGRSSRLAQWYGESFSRGRGIPESAAELDEDSLNRRESTSGVYLRCLPTFWGHETAFFVFSGGQRTFPEMFRKNIN